MKRPKLSRPISCLPKCAIAALVVGSGYVLIVLPLAGHIRGWFCIDNTIQVGMGLLMYAEDYDAHMPAGNRWMDAVHPYVKDESMFHCPEAKIGASEPVYGYAFNNSLGGKSIKTPADPQTTPLLYDSNNLTRNASDPATSVADPPRHGNSNAVEFLDGHARMMTGSALHEYLRKSK